MRPLRIPFTHPLYASPLHIPFTHAPIQSIQLFAYTSLILRLYVKASTCSSFAFLHVDDLFEEIMQTIL
jgi:hypothetical protein